MKQNTRLFTEDDVKLDVHVCTHNEELMLPHFLNHYSQYTDRIFIHDQHSTDNTINIATKYGCIINTWGSSYINDIDLLDQKHKAYYSSTTCDYVVIVDCDEFIIHDDLLGKLNWCKKNNILVPKSHGFCMYYDNFDFLNNDISDIQYGTIGDSFNQKNCIIRSNQNLKYYMGCHKLESPYQHNYIDNNPIKYCHMKFINFNYLVDRYTYFSSRLSTINKEHKWGIQYLDSYNKIESDFNYMKNNSMPIVDLYKSHANDNNSHQLLGNQPYLRKDERRELVNSIVSERRNVMRNMIKQRNRE